MDCINMVVNKSSSFIRLVGEVRRQVDNYFISAQPIGIPLCFRIGYFLTIRQWLHVMTQQKVKNTHFVSSKVLAMLPYPRCVAMAQAVALVVVAVPGGVVKEGASQQQLFSR
jgi:hypothetical protein